MSDATPGLWQRAVLCEWVKFCCHLDLEDEVIRNLLVSLVFEVAADTSHSFTDYEQLLGFKK